MTAKKTSKRQSRAKKATATGWTPGCYRMDPQPLAAKLRNDDADWVNGNCLSELFGWKLPYYSGGDLLSEIELSRLLDLSTRQIRTLAKRGLPRQLVDGHWRYPALDAMHWRLAFERAQSRTEGRSISHLDLADARKILMDVNLELPSGDDE